MTDVFIGRLMSSPVELVAASTPVRTAATTMLTEDIGSLVVTDDEGRLTGILTTTDFVHVTADAAAVDGEGDATGEATVADYMTTDVVTVSATDSIKTAAELMADRGFHHLPVVDDDSRVVGMLTTADLTAYLSHLESTPLA